MMQEINDGDRCYAAILLKSIRVESIAFLRRDAVSIQEIFLSSLMKSIS